jgi:glycosyltransferase involved in cell wall biosynthesis
MIKVLLVVCSNRMYGTERYVLELAKNLSKDKFTVWVAVPEKGPLSEILEESGINEIVYENRKLNRFSLKGAFNLFKQIRKFKFDIIHTNAGIIPNIIGKILGIKVNIEIKHGILIPDEILENMSLRKKWHEWIKQFFIDYFIAISENDKKKMVKFFNIKESKIKVIYNGVEYNKLLPYQKKKKNNELSPVENCVILGTIGRFTYQKGQEILIEAFSNIYNNFNNVKLIIVGSGENEDSIKRLIIDKNLQDHIVVEGYKENIYEFLKMLDIFILTSRFEGVPYVILEAMCIGVPIISTKVGGIDNILENEVDAILTEKNNALDTERAIVKLIEDKYLRTNIAVNAIQKVQRYSIDAMVKNTEKLYFSKID